MWLQSFKNTHNITKIHWSNKSTIVLTRYSLIRSSHQHGLWWSGKYSSSLTRSHGFGSPWYGIVGSPWYKITFVRGRFTPNVELPGENLDLLGLQYRYQTLGEKPKKKKNLQRDMSNLFVLSMSFISQNIKLWLFWVIKTYRKLYTQKKFWNHNLKLQIILSGGFGIWRSIRNKSLPPR